MSYLPAIILFVAGLVLLGLLVVPGIRKLRRFRRVTSTVVTGIQDGVGLLRARVAGVRVALAQRRH